MIQTFFIHPHESINFHCQDLSFLLKFIIMEEAKGFLVHKKRWVELWKDKSSKWLLDSENQRCQKQGFLQINVALEVNDHSRLVCPKVEGSTNHYYNHVLWPFFREPTIQQMADPSQSCCFSRLVFYEEKLLFMTAPHDRYDRRSGPVTLEKLRGKRCWRDAGTLDTFEKESLYIVIPIC